MKNIVFLAVSFLFINISIYSQKVEGYVYTALDTLAIPSANVSILNTTKGTVTNDDGKFTLHVKDLNDTLEISFIGFAPLKVQMKDALNQNEYYLEEEENTLDMVEFFIEPLEPIDILKMAIDSIPVNYSLDPTVTEGYIKETVWQNNKMQKLIEAAIEVWNPKYLKNSDSLDVTVEEGKNLVKLLNVRNKIDKLYPIKQSGSFNTVTEYLYIDQNISFIKDNIDVLQYKLEEENINFGGVDAYKITFRSPFPKSNSSKKYSLYRGDIYISKETYAIIKLDYTESNYGDKKENTFRFSGKQTKKEKVVYGKEVSINYKKYEDKWYVNFVKQSIRSKITLTDLESKLPMSRRISKYNFKIQNSFSATEIQTDSPWPFREEEIVDARTPIYRQLGTSSSVLWDSFNAIDYTKEEQEFLKSAKQ